MHLRNITLTIAALLWCGSAQAAWSENDHNVMYYWGQSTGKGQKPLAWYCETGKADAVLLSFIDAFNVGDLPRLNLADACKTKFPDSDLLHCPAVEKDIKKCQSLGVKVILSLGGASGSYGLKNNHQGRVFAQTIWDLFGGGSSETRPFGSAKIDGIDLDIEGGPSTGYVAFVKAVRSKFGSDFLIGAAPQCPFPDVILGSVIDAVGMDYLNVQFYNNDCSAAGHSFNFDEWADWATSKSPNKDVKIFFTTPGSKSAAGSGYVPISKIKKIVPELESQYPSIYGGVSIWDASQAWQNGHFASNLYSIVKKNKKREEQESGDAPKSPAKDSRRKHSKSHTKPTLGSTSPPESCPSNGDSCSHNGQYVCTAGGAYAICNQGTWSVAPCSKGTVCVATSDGNSIYCGYATGSSDVCGAPSAREITRITFIKGGMASRPYRHADVQSQLTIVKSDAKSFEAYIYSRRTSMTPFTKSVTLDFTVPPNVKVTSVKHGKVRQYKNHVHMTISNIYTTSMSIFISFSGTVSSGVFVAPHPTSLRFKEGV